MVSDPAPIQRNAHRSPNSGSSARAISSSMGTAWPLEGEATKSPSTISTSAVQIGSEQSTVSSAVTSNVNPSEESSVSEPRYVIS